MTAKRHPKAQAELLIRKAPREVFRAFVEPEILVRFWLSRASGPLEVGKTVRWDFKVKGVGDDVTVLALETDRRIRVRWSDQTLTEWSFEALTDAQTVVRVEQWGFAGEGDARVDTLVETTKGWTLVLSDLKVLLERGVQSNIVADKAVLIERAMKNGRESASDASRGN